MFGALIRIYVYEQDDVVVSGKNKGRDVITTSLQAFKSKKGAKGDTGTSSAEEPPHYHTLECESYGGPSKQDAQEMVYWQGKCKI